MSDTHAESRRHHAVLDFAHALVSASLNRLLHARDSQFVADAMVGVVHALQRAAAAGVELPLRLQVDDTHISYDGRPLDGPSLQARSLLDHCARRELCVLSFGPHVTATEVNSLFDLLLLPQNVEAFRRDHRDAAFTAYGIRNIKVSLRNPAAPDDRGADIDAHGRAVRRYQSLTAALHDNHRRAHGDHELDTALVATAVEGTLAAAEDPTEPEEAPSMLLSLSMQDDVDAFTVGHSVRVALLALEVARHSGASRDQLVRVGAAALMHDIGKSKVPHEILFKQGHLTEEEWHWMAQHPRLGAQILIEQHEHVDPGTIGAAFCHHMREHGGGYPESVLPFRPSATSRLIRVCDVFEALTAVRPYKRALTPVEAFAVMFANEHEFDGEWLRRFVHTLGLFPTGTRVQLVGGGEAIVSGQTDDVARPRLRLLSGPDGAELPADHPEAVRTGDAIAGVPVQIHAVVTHDRHVEVPEFERDPDATCPGVHAACLGSHHRTGP
ncbi:MAG TPA: HD domain-containing protein [bacterium]|nr:HD domain-containing protein [bacterium]